MSVSSGSLVRAIGIAGASWGVLQLTRGPAIWTSLEGDQPSGTESGVIAVLGGRHLAQGLAEAVWPNHGQAWWAVVDLTHAASMVAFAAVGRDRYRRVALCSGAVALTNGLLTLVARRRQAR
ncbi:MAG: hypothetical protein L0H41_00305 [Microlunatus sp.]|nr:hypothetical protein [Microlunatus sp.]MDN5772107.1 hypothetical protein [Microlunatus sp.]MDN5803753.1 hypothetical protein [Microlunatus sp.]